MPRLTNNGGWVRLNRAKFNPQNTPYERYLKMDEISMKWDMSAYDPNFIQNKVSYEEVDLLLTRLAAEPIPPSPDCIGPCCGLDYMPKVKAYKDRLNKMLEEENTRIGLRGVHWAWAGGSNEYFIPCLLLDFAIGAMGNPAMMGMTKAMGNPLMPGGRNKF